MQVSKEFRGELYQTIGHVNSLIGGAYDDYLKTGLLHVQALLNVISRNLEAEPAQPAESPQSAQNMPDGLYTQGKANPGQCSGPLPGGKDITVVQTPEKTLFIEPPEEAFNRVMTFEVEPPKGANAIPSEIVTPILDFTGLWKTRGGSFVEVTGYSGTEKQWMGHYTDRQGAYLYWDENGLNDDRNLDLMDRHRDGAGFANA